MIEIKQSAAREIEALPLRDRRQVVERIERLERLDQAGKILDLSPEKLEVRFNSEWLAKMSFADVIRLASKMSVARMLEREL